MEPYAQQLEQRLAALDDQIASLESELVQLRAQRLAYGDALNAFRALHGTASPTHTTGVTTAHTLPDASTRLQAILEILTKQPGQMMKAGPLKDAVSAAVQYPLSRHHVADLLRAHPECFVSPRRGYWVLVKTPHQH